MAGRLATIHPPTVKQATERRSPYVPSELRTLALHSFQAAKALAQAADRMEADKDSEAEVLRAALRSFIDADPTKRTKIRQLQVLHCPLLNKR